MTKNRSCACIEICLLRDQTGVADKPQMGLKTGSSQSVSQTRNAAGKTASVGIGVRACTGEEGKQQGRIIWWFEAMQHNAAFSFVCLFTLLPVGEAIASSTAQIRASTKRG